MRQLIAKSRTSLLFKLVDNCLVFLIKWDHDLEDLEDLLDWGVLGLGLGDEVKKLGRESDHGSHFIKSTIK